MTLAECCFDTGGIGAEVSIDAVASRARPRAERGGGAVRRIGLAGRRLGVARRRDRGARSGRRRRACRRGSSARPAGTGCGSRSAGESAIDMPVDDAERAWSTAIERYFVKQGRLNVRQVQGRVRRLRHLRPPRGGQHDLPRPVRAAAPRAGERRHRRVRRRSRCASRSAMGYVADIFDGDDAVAAARADGDRPRPLLDRRREQAVERAADPDRLRARPDRHLPQRQPRQRAASCATSSCARARSSSRAATPRWCCTSTRDRRRATRRGRDRRVGVAGAGRVFARC